MLEYLNILSVIIAFVAVIYLFITAKRFDKGLKGAVIYLGIGVLIAAALHSLAEALEAFGYLSPEILGTIMPILVLIGSLFLIIGTYKLYRVIEGV